MSNTVKVAVVGDAGTGKTTLISTACKGNWDARPVPVLPPARLSPEFTPALVPMVVTDTSSRPEDQGVVDLVLQTSDVIVVCFDATRQPTLDSIRNSWYTRTQRLNPDAPIVMSCCKAELMSRDSDILLLRERVEAAVEDLPSVESCLQVSAKQKHNVGAIFEYALKSVLYPLQPLYDRFDKRLKPLCVRALKRVFMMCDADGDGALNDMELNTFQLVCYGAALSNEELQSVKQVVASRLPSGVTAAGVTLDGFLFLHVLFIERGCLESIWAVLRKFGYNDQLRLRDEVLDGHVNFDLPPDQVYELSDVAEEFLRAQFSIYDLDGDGLISWQQLDAMFHTIPPPMWQGEEWSRLLVPGVYGATHHMEAFLLKWRYSVLQCPRTALAHMLYLGAGSPEGSGANLLLQQRTRRKPDKKHRVELAARSSLQCYVFGARGSGKSTLIHALPGLRPSPADLQPPSLATSSNGPTSAAAQTSPSKDKASSAAAAATGGTEEDGSEAASTERRCSGPFAAVAPVRGPMGGRERTLVMQEISEDLEQQLLTTAAMTKDFGAPLLITPPRDVLDSKASVDLAKADVAAFVFDASSTESFRAAVNLMVQVSTLAGDTLPCVLVAAKEDLVMGAQLEKELAAVIAELQVRGPVRCSALLGELGGVFGTLAMAAVCPEGWVPETPDRKARRQLVHQVATVACVCGITLASCGALYTTYRLLRPASTTSSTSTNSAPGNTSSRTQSSISSVREGEGGSLAEHAGSVLSRLPGVLSGVMGAASSKEANSISSVREGEGGSSSSRGESGSNLLFSLAEHAGSALSRLPGVFGGLMGSASSKEDNSSSSSSSSTNSGGGGVANGSQQGSGSSAGLSAFLPSIHAHSVAEGPCLVGLQAGSALSQLPAVLGGMLGLASSREDSSSSSLSSSGGGGVASGSQQGGGSSAGLSVFLPPIRAHSVAEGPCSSSSVQHGSYPLCSVGAGSLALWHMLPEALSTENCSDSWAGCAADDGHADGGHADGGHADGGHEKGGPPHGVAVSMKNGSAAARHPASGTQHQPKNTPPAPASAQDPAAQAPSAFLCSITHHHTLLASSAAPASSAAQPSSALLCPTTHNHKPSSAPAQAPAAHLSLAPLCPKTHHQPGACPASAAPAANAPAAPLSNSSHYQHQSNTCSAFTPPTRPHASAFHQPTSQDLPLAASSCTGSDCGGSPLAAVRHTDTGSSCSRCCSNCCMSGCVNSSPSCSSSTSTGHDNRSSICSSSSSSSSRNHHATTGMSGCGGCSSPSCSRSSQGCVTSHSCSNQNSCSCSSSIGSEYAPLCRCRNPNVDFKAPRSRECAPAVAAAAAAASLAGTSNAAVVAAAELVWLASALGWLSVRYARRKSKWL